jgi:ATP-binding cassette, subfamily G (WHITE), member 2, PDR
MKESNIAGRTTVQPVVDTIAIPIQETKVMEQHPDTKETLIDCEKKCEAEEIDLDKSQSGSISSQETFQNPFLSLPSDSEINPKSSRFSARAWMTNLVGFLSKDATKYPHRTASVSFRNLRVHGFCNPTDYQKTVGNIILETGSLFRRMTQAGKKVIQILKGFDGLVDRGEMLLVLGRPGSGCSTLLKAISGDTHGFFVAPESRVNYQGIPAGQMHGKFRGEAIYMAETDIHFPHLTVGQTLLFAAKARAPRDGTFLGVTREMYAEHMRDVVMATFGLSHTIDTNVGSDLVKGVSGGERKRVSIAEAILSGSPLQCWDNSTRGLDSANALEFCSILRLSTELAGATACVALYQASQSAYEVRSYSSLRSRTMLTFYRSLIKLQFCMKATRYISARAVKPRHSLPEWDLSLLLGRQRLTS